MNNNPAKYTTEEIEAYFRNDPEFFDTKRGYETLAGLILAKAHQMTYGSQADVGFEIEDTGTVTRPRNQPSLERLLVESNFIDRDADICVVYESPDGKWMISRIQVTRVEERASGDCSYDRMLNLIKKKTLVQTDLTLQLAVLVDETFNLELAKLNSELHKLKIPYARIYLVSQKGIKPIPDTFVCYEVYPEVAKTDDILVHIGQDDVQEQQDLADTSQTRPPNSGPNFSDYVVEDNQDRRGKIPLLTIRQNHIIQLIHKRPELLDNKKMHEMVVGWLLAQFFTEEEKKDLYIGFPMPLDWEQKSGGHITLDTILDRRTNFIEDRDVDISIGKDETWQKCQVTRFLNPEVSKKKRRLADLIGKKCLMTSPDPNIALVISLESRPHITLDELKGLPIIPFGRIFLIGKASNERGHFNLSQLYPKPVIGKDIRVPLPV